MIEIFEFILNKELNDLIHQESCFELANIYLEGIQKNFKKSKNFFEECISNKFKI